MFSYLFVSQLCSVLSIKNVPDPQKTHFLWGLSKDFGVASFRFGVLHTYNKQLMKVMESMALYTGVEGHIQQVGARILNDSNWLDNIYFPNNLGRLKAAYEECETFFNQLGCQVRKCQAGLFAWVNFSPCFKGKEITFEDEKTLFSKLLNEYKLYIPNGCEFGCKDPGWFRIIFAVSKDKWVEFTRRFLQFHTDLNA